MLVSLSWSNFLDVPPQVAWQSVCQQEVVRIAPIKKKNQNGHLDGVPQLQVFGDLPTMVMKHLLTRQTQPPNRQTLRPHDFFVANGRFRLGFHCYKCIGGVLVWKTL